MSPFEPPKPSGETYTVNGHCLCGAIQYKVNNIDLNSAIKCNCTICGSTGFISVRVGENDLVLLKGDEPVTNYENSRDGFIPELATWTRSDPNNPKQQGYRHFCSKCGVHPFLTSYVELMGGPMNCVNMRTLDLKAIGKDIKDFSAPKSSHLPRWSHHLPDE